MVKIVHKKYSTPALPPAGGGSDREASRAVQILRLDEQDEPDSADDCGLRPRRGVTIIFQKVGLTTALCWGSERW